MLSVSVQTDFDKTVHIDYTDQKHSHPIPHQFMSEQSNPMAEVYDLVELNQKLTTDARKVRPEDKQRFVQLADRAIQEGWADQFMGGEDVQLSILDNRKKFERYLGTPKVTAA